MIVNYQRHIIDLMNDALTKASSDGVIIESFALSEREFTEFSDFFTHVNASGTSATNGASEAFGFDKGNYTYCGVPVVRAVMKDGS